MNPDEATGQADAPDHLHLLADDAVGAGQDKLGRQQFGDAAALLINRVATQTPSSVLGLIGPWGSGKTSVLNFFEKALGSDWKKVHFSPWAVSDLEASIQEFFSGLITAFPKKGKGKVVRTRLSKYAMAVSPLARLIPGIDVAGAIEGLAKQLAADDSFEGKHRELVAAMKGWPTKVVVIIDDLDRLHPDELLLVFKLVRLVGRLPGVYYMLAFDETSILDVLVQTDIARDDRSRALRFLEKIVQVRVDLPPLHGDQIDGLVDESVQFILISNSITVEDSEWREFSFLYQQHIRPHLTEPRSIKRYFGQVEAYWPLVADEVNFVDFLLLTFLRTFYPDAYRLLPESKDRLTATMGSLLTKATDRESVLEAWRTDLKERGVPTKRVPSVLAIMSHMFVPIREILDSLSIGVFAYNEMYRAKRVGSPDYFDRYFQFAVPDSDVSDRLVAQAVREIQEESPGPATAEIMELATKNGDQIVSKLALAMETFTAEQAALALKFLSTIYAVLTGVTQDPFRTFFPATSRAEMWAGDLLSRGALTAPIDLEAILAEKDGANLLISGLHHACKDSEAAEPSPLDDVVVRVGDALRLHFSHLHAVGLEDADDSVWVMAELASLEKDDKTKEWFKKVLAEAEWPKDQILGFFVGVSTSFGATPTQSVSQFSEKHFDALIGLDRVDDFLDHGLGPLGLDEINLSDVTVKNRALKARVDLLQNLKPPEAPGDISEKSDPAN